MRYMFGFRGDALVSGLPGGPYNAAQITQLLDAANSATPNPLNPDGSATKIADALSDGVIIRRYLQYYQDPCTVALERPRPDPGRVDAGRSLAGSRLVRTFGTSSIRSSPICLCRRREAVCWRPARTPTCRRNRPGRGSRRRASEQPQAWRRQPKRATSRSSRRTPPSRPSTPARR